MDLEAFYERAFAQTVDIGAHLPTFTAITREMNAQQIIEIGVGAGISTSAWLLGLEQTGGRLWSVDILHDTRAAELLGIVDTWTYIVGDSLTHYWCAPWSADILFIDSLHEQAHVTAELDLYVPHLRPGAAVFLHDTGNGDTPVAHALNQWCANREIEWSNNPDCYGLGFFEWS